VAVRMAAHFARYRNLAWGSTPLRNLAIVGGEAESTRVRSLLQAVGVHKNIIGTIAPSGLRTDADLQDITRLDEVVRIYRINELIFCSKDISAQEILAAMTRLGPELNYQIMPEESMSIIGSSSKNEPGQLYTIDIQYNLAQPGQRRNKRVFDLLVCAAMPVLLLYRLFTPSANFTSLLRAWPSVFVARRSWVGYAGTDTRDLPKLKPGVCTPLDGLQIEHPDAATTKRLNTLYAKDWSVWRDVEMMMK
jgi:hypothetical protein